MRNPGQFVAAYVQAAQPDVGEADEQIALSIGIDIRHPLGRLADSTPHASHRIGRLGRGFKILTAPGKPDHAVLSQGRHTALMAKRDHEVRLAIPIQIVPSGSIQGRNSNLSNLFENATSLSGHRQPGEPSAAAS